MATATLPPPPRKTANPAPQRPAQSVRRTCSIDVSWPDGEGGDRLFIGRVRDYRTPEAGKPGTVLDEAEYRARLAQDKTITAITAAMATINRIFCWLVRRASALRRRSARVSVLATAAGSISVAAMLAILS